MDKNTEAIVAAIYALPFLMDAINDYNTEWETARERGVSASTIASLDERIPNCVDSGFNCLAELAGLLPLKEDGDDE